MVHGHGEEIRYDKLVVAVGARPQPAVPARSRSPARPTRAAVARAVEETARLAFVVPSASTWSLPAYELAIMAADRTARPRRRARDHRRHAGAGAAVGIRPRGRRRGRRAARASAAIALRTGARRAPWATGGSSWPTGPVEPPTA